MSHIISLNLPTRSLSITGHWNVSLPSGASPWNSIFWGQVEGQNITKGETGKKVEEERKEKHREREREREREKRRVRKRRRKVEEEHKEGSGVARNPQAL